MEFFSLPAYNKAREMTRQLLESTQKVPRDFRYTYVRDTILLGMSIMEHISFANDDLGQRAEFLDKAIKDLHSIMIKARIMYDLKHISRKGYNSITKYEGQLESQLIGWRKSTLDKIEKSR